ncbi:unnamed protein product [Haemonchus placei]|uniref:Thioredoxin-like_fold domain-containing protein n=1 Tax=Haemonchus placei TaxID=6290 RepID=A0A0N4W2P9_HAEPC|nr:unnamed protein product [Haemonchus placei]
MISHTNNKVSEVHGVLGAPALLVIDHSVRNCIKTFGSIFNCRKYLKM